MSEPTEQELDEIRRDIFIKRVRDLRGWLLESFTEANDDALAYLANTILDRSSDQNTVMLRIGYHIADLVHVQCTPTDAEVYAEWARVQL